MFFGNVPILLPLLSNSLFHVFVSQSTPFAISIYLSVEQQASKHEQEDQHTSLSLALLFPTSGSVYLCATMSLLVCLHVCVSSCLGACLSALVRIYLRLSV